LPGLLELYPALRLACNSKEVVLFNTTYKPTQLRFYVITAANITVMGFWVMTPCKLVGTDISKEHAGSVFYPKFEGKILFPQVFIHQHM
jgi:hypothetical protein